MLKNLFSVFVITGAFLYMFCGIKMEVKNKLIFMINCVLLGKIGGALDFCTSSKCEELLIIIKKGYIIMTS